MSLTWLKASLRVWLRRLTYRRSELAQARIESRSGAGGATPGVITRSEAARINKWKANVAEAERKVALRRKQIAAKTPKPSGGRATPVNWAASKVGIKERPPSSNGNPANISAWQQSLGFGRVPWCGIFCAKALQAAGVRGVSSRLAAVVLIEDDARAGRAPFSGWTASGSSVQPGDLVVVGGRGVHVELVRQRSSDGSCATIGGNTSAGPGGSQSNGGMVARRVRSRGEIRGYAKVRYP